MPISTEQEDILQYQPDKGFELIGFVKGDSVPPRHYFMKVRLLPMHFIIDSLTDVRCLGLARPFPASLPCQAPCHGHIVMHQSCLPSRITHFLGLLYAGLMLHAMKLSGWAHGHQHGTPAYPGLHQIVAAPATDCLLIIRVDAHEL